VNTLTTFCPNTGDSDSGAHEARLQTMVAAQGGTRALFLNDASDEDYFSESVVAWGLYVCEDCGAQWTSPMVQADGKGDTLTVATAWGNLWRVLDPTEAFPSTEEAWAELRRRETEARRLAAEDELEKLFAGPAATQRNTLSPDNRAARRAHEALTLAQSWPSWREQYNATTAYAAAFRKALWKPSASTRALAMAARYAAEVEDQTP
jgi:hypothetical protein